MIRCDGHILISLLEWNKLKNEALITIKSIHLLNNIIKNANAKIARIMRGAVISRIVADKFMILFGSLPIDKPSPHWN